MQLTATDFHTYYSPSPCDLRVYLRAHGETEGSPGPYEEIIQRLGDRHEKTHLQTFSVIEDLSNIPAEEQEAATRKAIAAQAAAIYQPLLRTQLTLGGIACEFVGKPDFLIYEAGNYIIRDSKIARQITITDHPEIIRQLQFYGWLYREMLGTPPLRLEVQNGANQIVEVEDDGGSAALQEIQKILELKVSTAAPYSPVGWSKCGGCTFKNHCWPQAEDRQDVALLGGVDQGLATALYKAGIQTIDALIGTFDERQLSEFQRPWGTQMRRVGKSAGSILRMANAMFSGKESILANPDIPQLPNYVMFDLEGLPPQLDDLDKIYLWGMQVFGETPGQFMAACAGFGENGDREGWLDFLSKAQNIFDEHGDVRFVHWHHYEKTKVQSYIDRYGDVDGIAGRVQQNLLDLFSVVQRCMVLPLPSYSLKVVEKYVGFKRSQNEYGGDWSMAKYIEATETEDKQLRDQVMNEILTYNREDLEATWAVFQWLQQKKVGAH